MNPTNLPPHALPPSLGGIGSVRPLSHTGEGRLGAISGNDLLSLDVWGNVRASDRSFSAPNATLPGPAGQLDSMVAHILEPLG